MNIRIVQQRPEHRSPTLRIWIGHHCIYLSTVVWVKEKDQTLIHGNLTPDSSAIAFHGLRVQTKPAGLDSIRFIWPLYGI